MKKVVAFAPLAFALLAICGCSYIGRGVVGLGVRKTEKRDLQSFKSIDASGAYEIQVTCQKPAAFEIEGDDNILPLIKTEVRDGVLYVSNEKNYTSDKPVSLRITLPDLTGFSTHGAGKVRIIAVKNEQLELSSSGAADINASGQSHFVDIGSNGAGKIDTSNLRAEKVRVSIAGAGAADVYVTEQLDVTVSGAGHVTYGGDPKVVNKNVSGVGSLKKKE